MFAFLLHWSLIAGLLAAWAAFIGVGVCASEFVFGTKLGRVLYGAAFLALFSISLGLAVFDAGVNKGKANGDKEVATLQAKYATAYAQAEAAGRNAQERADALAQAQAQAREKEAQQRAQEAAGIASDAHARLLAAQRKLDEVSRHDATVKAWSNAKLPAGVIDSLHSTGN